MPILQLSKPINSKKEIIMQLLNSKVSINNADCELRARLRKTTKINWQKLKKDLETAKGCSYSDSAFLSYIIDEVLTPKVAAILK